MLAVAEPAGPNWVSFNRVSVLRTRNVLAPATWSVLQYSYYV